MICDRNNLSKLKALINDCNGTDLCSTVVVALEVERDFFLSKQISARLKQTPRLAEPFGCPKASDACRRREYSQQQLTTLMNDISISLS